MTDSPQLDADQNTGVDPERRSTTGPPRWVKVTWIVVAAVVALFLVVLLVRGPGGAGHGPGLHAPPAGGTEQGVQQR